MLYYIIIILQLLVDLVLGRKRKNKIVISRAIRHQKENFFFHKLITSGQSGKKQIPSVTGNLAQMIVCVHIVNM